VYPRGEEETQVENKRKEMVGGKRKVTLRREKRYKDGI
jgi:hypothetical protein